MNGVEVELSDMPAWVKAEVASTIKHKRNLVCRIHPVDEFAVVGHTWHDNARQIIVARRADGEMKRVSGGYYDSILNFTPAQRAVYDGGKIRLPGEGGQVLRMCIYFRLNNIDLYIRRDGPDMKLLNGLSDGTTLTQIQIAVLHLYTQLTSAGRKSEIGRNNIPISLVNVVTRELEDMGYLKIQKNGVRKTIEGKRMAEQTRGQREWSWYQWADCRNYNPHRFSGFAAEIIAEYRERMIEDMDRRKVK